MATATFPIDTSSRTAAPPSGPVSVIAKNRPKACRLSAAPANSQSEDLGAHYGVIEALAKLLQKQFTAFRAGVARRTRTGQVDVNDGAFNPCAPFGGVDYSGNGRELGAHGLEEFFYLKSIQR
jgi:aldehyde dehydrogenase (NAD+)